MKWKVVDSLICPRTGLVFSYLSAIKNLKLIIWYGGEIFLPHGSTVETFKKGVLLNGEYFSISVYHVIPYNESIWTALKYKAMCPANRSVELINCDLVVECMIKKCPYHMK